MSAFCPRSWAVTLLWAVARALKASLTWRSLQDAEWHAAHPRQNRDPWFGTLLPPSGPLTLWPGSTSLRAGGCSGLTARVETLGAHLAGLNGP